MLPEVDFFFSSKRRHTTWPRDWSSDVCSSDLTFDRLLIADAGIYTGREVKYAFKLTHFRALFHYLINRCRTNTLDRRHPVLNPPVPCHKFPLGRVDVRLIHRNSYSLTLLNKQAHLRS